MERTKRSPHRLGCFGLVVGCLLIGPYVAQAATFTVNSPSDVVGAAPLTDGVCETAPGNGVCTLRAAIMEANHSPGGPHTINVPAGTFTLTIPASGANDETTGDLNITANMSVVGSGASNTILTCA